MKDKKYWLLAAGILLAGVLLGQGLIKAQDTGESADVKVVEEGSAARSKLAVLWTSGDAGVANNVCLMYTHEAKKHDWFDDIVVIVWGPSAKLVAEDKEIQKKLKEMMDDGIQIKACIMCARNYGVVDDLRKLGIEVKGMGRPLTRMLKSDWKMLTF